MRAVVLVFLLVAARPGVMSLRGSQTETWRHSDVTVSGLGPLAKTLIPTPHNSPFCVLENCTC